MTMDEDEAWAGDSLSLWHWWTDYCPVFYKVSPVSSQQQRTSFFLPCCKWWSYTLAYSQHHQAKTNCTCKHTHTHMPSCAQSHKQKSRHFIVKTALFVYSVFQPDWDWDLQSVSLLRDHSCVFSGKKASTHWSLLGENAGFYLMRRWLHCCGLLLLFNKNLFNPIRTKLKWFNRFTLWQYKSMDF